MLLCYNFEINVIYKMLNKCLRINCWVSLHMRLSKRIYLNLFNVFTWYLTKLMNNIASSVTVHQNRSQIWCQTYFKVAFSSSLCPLSRIKVPPCHISLKSVQRLRRGNETDRLSNLCCYKVWIVWRYPHF